MHNRTLWVMSLLAILTLILAGCSANPSPTPQPAVPVALAPTPVPTAKGPEPTPTPTAKSLTAQVVAGGGMTVLVRPPTLKLGQAVEFGIVLDSHSVEIVEDMAKSVVLRTETGKEYTPAAWDGDKPGGHHRTGVIRFAPLTDQPRRIELIIKDVAGVPERLYRWELQASTATRSKP